MYLLAANLVLILHLLFICVVMLGGLAVLRRPRLALIHVPAAVWGFLVEAMGWYWPLTDLENALLRRAGEEGYGQGFLEHYLLALIYPDGLTREIQYLLGRPGGPGQRGRVRHPVAATRHAAKLTGC
jgi:hypothetical protein